MKSIALLKKELRECLPWVLLASAILFIFGFLILDTISSNWRSEYSYWYEKPGEELHTYTLFKWTSLSDVGTLLLFTCFGLGIALGIRQFWFSWFNKTWAFLLHRNLSRSHILWIKMAAAGFCFTLPILGIWTLLFLYAYFIMDYSPPPAPRIWLEGLFLIVLGTVPYLAAALSSALSAKWYTTRLFPFGFALVAVIFSFAPRHLWNNFLAAGIALLILGIPLFQEFKHREF